MSCTAGCVLENGWTIRPRNIYSFNNEAVASLPVINISMACNHCENPICLEGCPAGAFFRDAESGAVISDEKKCIGCKYCKWNCPYDAPKYNDKKGIIEKCHFCFQGLAAGRLPSCANACPTGALSYGEINVRTGIIRPDWFPLKETKPSLELNGVNDLPELKIIPQANFGSVAKPPVSKTALDWSLIFFSFFATLSVSVTAAELIKGTFPDFIFMLILISVTGITSLFHLGRPERAWRTIANIKTSPLSREIALFIIFSSLSLVAIIMKKTEMMIAASVAGMIFLLSVDSIYIYSDKRKQMIFHSGQTFISSLLLISFFTGSIYSFTFIVLVKSVFSGWAMFNRKSQSIFPGIRFARIAVMLIIWAGLISGYGSADIFVTLILAGGELLDRIIFYSDFRAGKLKNRLSTI